MYFQLAYLPEDEAVFSEAEMYLECTSQAVLGSSDQRKVPASLSLFLKIEKIPALLLLGKGLPGLLSKVSQQPNPKECLQDYLCVLSKP